MAVSETDQSQVSLEAEDLQSDPGQGNVGQEESVVMYIDGPPEWTSLTCLTPDDDGIDYIDYKRVIEEERLPAASPFTNMYAGALYAELAGENGNQSVYFEPQPDPARSVMRVASVEGYDTVIQFYPWDRVNFVYKLMNVEGVGKERTYKCYIYTPGNLGSYGLVVVGENVHFQRTPIQGTKPNFTTVDMKQKSTPPSGEDFGLYVHKAEDGWKVKATNDQNKWTTFSITSFKYQSPPETVSWDLASTLDLSYQKVLKERMPALFQESSGDNVFVGALHVESPSGKEIDSDQIVYFESAEPRKPRMRVAETKEVSHYSWDRINLVYYQVAAESSEYTFQIFTPANLGTYGLKATEEELIFEKLPEGEKHEEYFTHFQIKRGVSANPITTTTQHTTLGMYVDTSDGCKVKVTKEEEHWDKFSIAGFTQSSPEITAAKARSDS